MEGGNVPDSVEKDTIYPRYILIGTETLIMDRTIESIREQSKIDVSFDYDVFSIPETPFEEVLTKLYSTAFASPRRLIVTRNLEELDQKNLLEFARLIENTPKQNCLVMTYVLPKESRKHRNTIKTLKGTFKTAHCIVHRSDQNQVHEWIATKVKRDKLPLSNTLMRYLEEQFNNDITGLKNEFDKIENYLAEVPSIDRARMQDLAKGLCDFNVYQIIDGFLKGKRNSLILFEEIQPYLRSYLEIVGALTWGLMYHALRDRSILSNAAALLRMLSQIDEIDKGIKSSSYFSQIKLELFFLKNAQSFRKGAVYG